MIVGRRGSSLAVRLPKRFVDELGINAGDEVIVTAQPPDTILIEFPQADARPSLHAP
jgi:antitoxin component of MazEF toxin-antitoxin module